MHGMTNRVVAVGTGDPTCQPIERNGEGQFTCGERGTRCVCDAPDGVKYLETSHCRWVHEAVSPSE